jgi:hypothetical protein
MTGSMRISSVTVAVMALSAGVLIGSTLNILGSVIHLYDPAAERAPVVRLAPGAAQVDAR